MTVGQATKWHVYKSGCRLTKQKTSGRTVVCQAYGINTIAAALSDHTTLE